MRNLKRGWMMVFLLVAFGWLAACGSESEPAPEATAEAETEMMAEPTEIVIEANDQMQFNLNEFTVPAGAEVTLTLNNVGQMPKEAMGHNLIVLQIGTSVDEFGIAAAAAAATDYIPQDKADVIIANTQLLGPGESESITFTAPSEPGEYPFLCSFPGHYALMRGVMRVE